MNYILQEILRQKDGVVCSNKILTNGRKMSFCMNSIISTLAEIGLLVAEIDLMAQDSASYHETERNST